MINKYTTLLVAAILAGAKLQAVTLHLPAHIVVNIAIEGLDANTLDSYSTLFGSEGLNELINNGTYCNKGYYNYKPVNPASAITTIVTGTSPYYHGITGDMWLNKSSLRPVSCVYDTKYSCSAVNIKSSTLGDELKIATKGKALVYSIATDSISAILSAGHSADGAFWLNSPNGRWNSSVYYPSQSRKWLKSYQKVLSNSAGKIADANARTCELALACINGMALGKDDVADLINITLNSGNCYTPLNSELALIQLNKNISKLLTTLKQSVGSDKMLVTLTGFKPEAVYEDDETYQRYKVPNGKIDFARTANLLNIYLSAIYGQGKYIDAIFGNEIYLNQKLLEDKNIAFNDLYAKCKELLYLTDGIKKVYSPRTLNDSYEQRAHDPKVCGDIVVETNPGWKIVNSGKRTPYSTQYAITTYPIIICGNGFNAQKVSTPVDVECIAPTICSSIHIRAPNACEALPL